MPMIREQNNVHTAFQSYKMWKSKAEIKNSIDYSRDIKMEECLFLFKHKIIGIH